MEKKIRYDTVLNVSHVAGSRSLLCRGSCDAGSGFGVERVTAVDGDDD